MYRAHIFHPHDPGPCDPVVIRTIEQVRSYLEGLFKRRTIIRIAEITEPGWNGLYLVTGDGDSIFIQEIE